MYSCCTLQLRTLLELLPVFCASWPRILTELHRSSVKMAPSLSLNSSILEMRPLVRCCVILLSRAKSVYVGFFFSPPSLFSSLYCLAAYAASVLFCLSEDGRKSAQTATIFRNEVSKSRNQQKWPLANNLYT